MKPAPLVLIVGFLGAGKTTFLRELLPLLEARGMEPFVIINDYANARVDASSLTKEGRTVTPINGNCICCDSVIELLNVLLDIPITKRRIVLIEANGTTDPTSLIEHLLVNPELRRRFEPLLQVAIVDLKRWQKRHWHNQLERLQVETASHLSFTREETETKQRCAQVRADIEWFNAKAMEINKHSFALELEGLLSATEPQSTPAENEAESRCKTDSKTKDHHEHQKHDHQGEHHEHEEKHALSHGFVGVQIDLPQPMAAEHLQKWLNALPTEVLRVKGVVQLVEEPERWFQFQRVDEFRGEAALHELPQKPIVPPCAVLIGVKLDEVKIRNSLIECARTLPASSDRFGKITNGKVGTDVPS